MNLFSVVQLLAKHAALIELIIEAIESRNVSQDAIVSSIKALMEETSDTQMRKEFPNG